MKGTVYTETVVYAPPAAFVNDAPYQLAIITQENQRRLTGRIAGPEVQIGDTVEFIEDRNGIPFFKKTS